VLHELTRRAAGYRQERGTLDGFLASLPQDFRTRVERDLIAVTDDSASAVIHGRCLDVDLHLATLAERSC
jgi:hypothetical protein